MRQAESRIGPLVKEQRAAAGDRAPSGAVARVEAGEPGSPSPSPGPRRFHRFVSRTLDLAVSVPALIVAFPLILVIGAIVRLETPGPALFRHVRIGLDRRRGERRKAGGMRGGGKPERRRHERRQQNRHGRPFTLYKFRTMFVDARERFPSRYRYDYTEEQLSHLPMKVLLGAQSGDDADGGAEPPGKDPRLTRAGRFLRRTSLDELPNLINVANGDIALVGPRPDIEDNVRNYRPEHIVKFEVKPGVTGLAQVMGRGNLSFHRTNELDVEYVRRQSVAFDIEILFRTVVVVLKREGAY